MKSPIQRRAAIAALLLAPTLAACGFSVQTDQVYQPAVGIIDRSGPVDILNGLVVSGTDGSGTFAGTLVNTNTSTADRLVSVTGPGVTVARRTVDLPADSAVNLADSGQITLTGTDVAAGKYVELTFVFENGQSTTVKVPVVPAAGDFAKVPLPSARPSASQTATSG